MRHLGVLILIAALTGSPTSFGRDPIRATLSEDQRALSGSKGKTWELQRKLNRGGALRITFLKSKQETGTDGMIEVDAQGSQTNAEFNFRLVQVKDNRLLKVTGVAFGEEAASIPYRIKDGTLFLDGGTATLADVAFDLKGEWKPVKR